MFKFSLFLPRQVNDLLISPQNNDVLSFFTSVTMKINSSLFCITDISPPVITGPDFWVNGVIWAGGCFSGLPRTNLDAALQLFLILSGGSTLTHFQPTNDRKSLGSNMPCSKRPYTFYHFCQNMNLRKMYYMYWSNIVN